MHRCFRWAEWNALPVLIALLIMLQMLILGSFAVFGAEQLLLSREPVILELREGHAASAAQEFLVFLRKYAPVLRVTYRTREQQFLALQAMFPDMRFPEGGAGVFHDALLVHLRALQGYRSLLGALMVEPRWQQLVSPRSLVRVGEQMQEIRSLSMFFTLLRGGFLGAALLLVCALTLLLFHRARRSLGREEDNRALQEYLGSSPSLMFWPTVCRLTAVLFLGVLLSWGVLFLFFPFHHVWWLVLLLEGAGGVLLSAGGVFFSQHASCALLRCDRPPHD